VALGYVPAPLAASDKEFQIEILGDLRSARIQPQPLYDPNGGRMKA
jgi:dimethylglycine dehydrogenase